LSRKIDAARGVFRQPSGDTLRRGPLKWLEINGFDFEGAGFSEGGAACGTPVSSKPRRSAAGFTMPSPTDRRAIHAAPRRKRQTLFPRGDLFGLAPLHPAASNHRRERVSAGCKSIKRPAPPHPAPVFETRSPSDSPATALYNLLKTRYFQLPPTRTLTSTRLIFNLFNYLLKKGCPTSTHFHLHFHPTYL
jgi:hypothetical protein